MILKKRIGSLIGLKLRVNGGRYLSTRTSSTASSTSTLVDWTIDPETKIGTITLQSEKTYNALTVEMGVEFSEVCRQITHDLTTGGQDVPAIVLTGQGENAFSAGGNMEWLKSLRHNSVHHNADLMMNFYNSFLCIRKVPVPVIAAIQGPAIGAGAGLALACDLRTAARKERILGLNFARLGIHSGMGGSHLLERAMGAPSALMNEILLTGRILTGQECMDLGLVNRLSDDPKGDAYELAAEIAKQHPVAVRKLLMTLRVRQDEGLDRALQREALAQALCYARDDWGEGVTAVAEKRSPVFEPYHNH